MFLRVLPWLAILIFVYLWISQIVLPSVRGTKSFPLFRKKTISIENEITELRTELEDAVKIKKRDELKEQLNSLSNESKHEEKK